MSHVKIHISCASDLLQSLDESEIQGADCRKSNRKIFQVLSASVASWAAYLYTMAEVLKSYSSQGILFQVHFLHSAHDINVIIMMCCMH